MGKKSKCSQAFQPRRHSKGAKCVERQSSPFALLAEDQVLECKSQRSSEDQMQLPLRDEALMGLPTPVLLKVVLEISPTLQKEALFRLRDELL